MLPIFGVISASCLVVQELHDDLCLFTMLILCKALTVNEYQKQTV